MEKSKINKFIPVIGERVLMRWSVDEVECQLDT